MKLFPKDNDVVLYETCFVDDFLDRGPISKQLSDLVERIDDPIVLALNDTWGTGKSFFLKRWVAAHTNENDGAATTVYFDAFEHDYLSDPLVSIISAVSARFADRQEATVKEWKTVAAKLAKPAFGIALSLATFGAKQHLEDLGRAIADAAGGEAKDAVQDLWNVEKDRKDSVDEFRSLLSSLTQTSGAPIVIVVDELDRCRPDYALSVLEVIKHFFSVPKVHFVLGVNGGALENSVEARYGAEIDAESYLRKFIDVSFSLPRAVGERGEIDVVTKYTDKLIDEMGLPDRVSQRCANLIECIGKGRSVSLRDVGKILSKVALLPDVVHEKNWVEGYLDIICALLVTSVLDPQLHKKFISGCAQTAELRDYLSAPIEKTRERVNDQYNENFDYNVTVWLETLIYCCGSDEIAEVDDLPDRAAKVWERFDRFGLRDRKSIASGIQKDFIDIFRI